MRPGLVALGDSITNGEGGSQEGPASGGRSRMPKMRRAARRRHPPGMLGVRAWSWAQWLATALELPYTGLAADGAVAADLVARQLPRLDGPYAVGCLWIGVNDVRSVDFDLEAYVRDLRVAAEAVADACETVLMPTIPLDLGRPRAGAAKVSAANAAIRERAAAVGAAVVALDDLRGWRLVLPDAVHLTALGQLVVADRAFDALADRARSAGVDRHVRPSALAEADERLLASIRYALTGHAAALARDWRRRGVEALARRRAR